MTTNETMPETIWLWRNSYDAICISGIVDESNLDNYDPSHTKYLRADTVSAAVREAVEALEETISAMQRRGDDYFDDEQVKLTKALAALRGLGAE